MEDDNLLAEVRIRSVIRMERSWRSGRRMTDTLADRLLKNMFNILRHFDSGFLPFIKPTTPVVAFTSKGIPSVVNFFCTNLDVSNSW